jgi:hypothetical protein
MNAGYPNGKDPASRRLPRRRVSILREHRVMHKSILMSHQVLHLHRALLIKRQLPKNLARAAISVGRSDYYKLNSLLITYY